MKEGIFLDINAINRRAGNADWYFNLQPDGMLVILLRKRNVCETENAAKYLQAESAVSEKQKI